MRYRAEIDGLRTLAVIPVILYHLDFQLFSGGYVGVDIFFVISGFIIYYIYKKKKRSGFDFILQRMKRIIPLYWFYSLVVFIFFLLFPILFNKFTTDFNHLFLSLF